MEFKAGDFVVVKPGQEQLPDQHDITRRIYTIIPFGISERIVDICSLKEMPISVGRYAGQSNPAFWCKRFIKVDPKTISKLERVIYGLK